MAKIDANRNIKPLPNEFRNVDTLSDLEREKVYLHKSSADNPEINITQAQTRGSATGMVPIRNKNNR